MTERRSARLRFALRAAFVSVLVVAAATGRVVLGGERELAASTEALRAGDAFAAVDRARAAATWYVPGAPHVRVAYGRLLALAREAEARRLRDLALYAYRAVVTASASTEWLVVPHAADAGDAREAIARIEAAGGERSIDAATDPPEAIERRQLEALASPSGPSRTWSTVLAASFVAVLAGLGLVLRRAFDDTGRIHARPAALGAAVAGIGLVGYALALFFA